MPYYDYECPGSDETVSIFRSMFDDEGAKPRCATCGADMVRIYNAVPVRLTGDGWAGKSSIT